MGNEQVAGPPAAKIKSIRRDSRIVTEPESKKVPSIIAFCTFSLINILAAFYAPIQDCDEVFNYWEPTHYINHGFGLQTWEYSPDYAIRSWLYIVLHALPGKIGSLLLPKRRYEFYFVRCVLAMICAATETCLFRSVSKAYNTTVASILMIALVTTPGMFYASAAYLPSSFAMYTSTMGLVAFLSFWNESRFKAGITWFGIGATVGWPFSAALILPLFTTEIVDPWLNGRGSEVVSTISEGAVQTSLIVPLQTAFDSAFYRKVVFVPWRIVSYNIFSGSSRGPDIFGTEPWHFYIRNLLLNFNAWFLLAMCSGPFLLLRCVFQSRNAAADLLKHAGLVAPFYLWLAIFSGQAHKEERFMYPAYPFLVFNAALALHYILSYLGNPHTLMKKVPAKARLFLVFISVLFMTIVGVLRIAGTVSAYAAPLEIYASLQNSPYAQMQGNVCLGKEWYRFPSSYFLPENMRAKFIKSAFDGLLPGEFSEATSGAGLPPTWLIPPGMNDENIEDPGKHIDIGDCKFLVDSYFTGSELSSVEPHYILHKEKWEEVKCSRFLDVSQTHVLGRIFYLPEWSMIPAKYHRKWGKYCLLQRTPS